MMIKRATIILVSMFILSSCNPFASWKTFYETTHNGEKFILQEKETKWFSTNHFDWRFRLGDMPFLPIDARSTDWGAPYSKDLYGQAPFGYITDQDTAYIKQESDSLSYHTFLYVNPSKVSKKEFEAYLKFMKEHWDPIDRKYKGKDLRSFPHIIGLVYGKNEVFCKQFKGSMKYLGTGPEKDFVLEIKPDGRVILEQNGSSYSSGLSDVIMPGKILEFKKGNHTLAELKSLKDEFGKEFTAYFTVTETSE